jgi:putative ABC transport system substrate-binding protein
VAEAQQQAKAPKIGWLSGSSASSLASLHEAIRSLLRELGYVESKNISFEYRYADNKPDRLPALADELVRLKVDVLLVGGVPAALAAKNATRTIPIVFYSLRTPLTENGGSSTR